MPKKETAQPNPLQLLDPKNITELKSSLFWSYSVLGDKGTYKRPAAFKKNKPVISTTYHEAIDNAITDKPGNVGLVFVNPSTIIGLDVDPDDVIPGRLLDFLLRHPTYVEVSPSGIGVHVLYRLSHEDAQLLYNRKFTMAEEELHYHGDIRFAGKLYLTYTGNALTKSNLPSGREADLPPQTEEINEIKLTDLFEICDTLKREVNPSSNSSNVMSIGTPLADDHATFRSDDDVSVEKVLKAVTRIPPAYNFIVARAYDQMLNKITEDYYHWLNICNGLAHTAIVHGLGNSAVETRLFNAFMQFSRAGNFVDEQRVIDKWRSCYQDTLDKLHGKADGDIITGKTITKLASLCNPKYPKLLALKSSTASDPMLYPDPDHLDNLAALYDFYDIAFISDQNSLVGYHLLYPPEAAHLIEDDASSAETTAVKHPTYTNGRDYNALFMSAKSLRLSLITAAQRHDFPSTVIKRLGVVGEKLETTMFRRESIDATFKVDKVAEWFRSRSYVKPVSKHAYPLHYKVFKSITFQDSVAPAVQEHFYGIFCRLTMWMANIREYKGIHGDCPCTIIFSGAENIGKTTWWKTFVSQGPLGSKNYATEFLDNIKKSEDLIRLIHSVMLFIMEESVTPGSAMKHKHMLSNSVDSYRRLFGDEFSALRRVTPLVGTTNEKTLETSRHGNRRLSFWKVENCDSKILEAMDMQQFFAEAIVMCEDEWLRLAAKGLEHDYTPWRLTEEQVAMNTQLAAEVSTSTDADKWFDIIYDTSIPFDVSMLQKPDGRMLDLDTLKERGLVAPAADIRNEILRVSQGSPSVLKLAHIIYVADDKCGAWTDTKSSTLEVGPEGSKKTRKIRSGQTSYGTSAYYITPPKRDATLSFAKQDETE